MNDAARRSLDQQRLKEWNAGAPIRIQRQRSLLERDDYDDWDDGEPDDDDFYDCGWVRGQGCQLAGSEDCDFECPHRDALYRGIALTRARMAKRAARGKEQG